MAYTQTLGRGNGLKTGADLPASLNSGSANSTDGGSGGGTTPSTTTQQNAKNVRLKSGQIVKKSTTTTTTPGTPGTPETIIKGKSATPAILPTKNTGPKASDAEWTKYVNSPQGKATKESRELKTKGTPGTPGTPDTVIPGTPATPGTTNTETKQENIGQPIYSWNITRGYSKGGGYEDVKKSFGNTTTDKRQIDRALSVTKGYNEQLKKSYAPVEEGSIGARGMVGKALENRNARAADRLTRLTRTVNVDSTSGLLGLAGKEARVQKTVQQARINEANTQELKKRK